MKLLGGPEGVCSAHPSKIPSPHGFSFLTSSPTTGLSPDYFPRATFASSSWPLTLHSEVRIPTIYQSSQNGNDFSARSPQNFEGILQSHGLSQNLN